MKLFLVSVVFAFAGLAFSGIVDGKNVDIKECPYQATVKYSNHIYCEGTIISPKHVLTTAKFLERKLPELLSVYVGSSNQTSGGEEYKVKSYRAHSQFNDIYLDNDIAILTLSNSLIFGPTIQAIKLAEEGQERKGGDIATVSGWRTDDGSQGSPTFLQKIELPIVDRDLCKKQYSTVVNPRKAAYINEHVVCAGQEKSLFTNCNGVDGDPLVINDTLVGLYSSRDACMAPGIPGVYQNIAYYRKFIKESTGI